MVLSVGAAKAKLPLGKFPSLVVKRCESIVSALERELQSNNLHEPREIHQDSASVDFVYRRIVGKRSLVTLSNISNTAIFQRLSNRPCTAQDLLSRGETVHVEGRKLLRRLRLEVAARQVVVDKWPFSSTVPKARGMLRRCIARDNMQGKSP